MPTWSWPDWIESGAEGQPGQVGAVAAGLVLDPVQVGSPAGRQVARAVAGRFADGAWLAELAPTHLYWLWIVVPRPPNGREGGNPAPALALAPLSLGCTGLRPAVMVRAWGCPRRRPGGVHGFPAALTSFVGRAKPVREVAGLVEQHRLVTVAGPGGAGKTRLACEVARAVAGRFADGAWLAELAPVQDPALVVAVVAAVLGVREQPGVPLAGMLARVLARRQLLLVLDNCEH